MEEKPTIEEMKKYVKSNFDKLDSTDKSILESIGFEIKEKGEKI